MNEHESGHANRVGTPVRADCAELNTSDAVRQRRGGPDQSKGHHSQTPENGRFLSGLIHMCRLAKD